MSFPGNRPKGMSFGNEYGLYDDIDESSTAITNISPSHSSVKLIPDLSRKSKVATTLSIETPSKLICEVDDTSSPIVCKTFTSSNSSSFTASISIEGLRIVQVNSTEDAEYNVVLRVDGRVYSSWRRFSDFRELGDAFQKFCDYGLLLKRARQHAQTLRTWQKVINHRPCLLKDLSVTFLREQFALLEEFLKSVLYELVSLELLLAFVTQKGHSSYRPFTL